MAAIEPSMPTPVNDIQKFSVGTKDKSVGWYTTSIEDVAPSVRDLLENYSKLPPSQVVPHVLDVPYCETDGSLKRDRAWDIFPYPCIGQIRFIDLCLMQTPSYTTILSRLHAGAAFLDLGCCFAQDLRRLVHDGAPAARLYGAELEGAFLDLGYDLFRDEATLGATFMVADIFDMTPEAPLKALEDKMDIVQIGLFLHLFDWPRQRTVCERLTQLLKKEKGVLIVGQQIGSTEPGEVPNGRGKTLFKHDVQTFERLWKEVGETTGSQWEVKARLDDGLGIGQKKRCWDDPKTKRLVFEVERIG